jgi:hypothetical protein
MMKSKGEMTNMTDPKPPTTPGTTDAGSQNGVGGPEKQPKRRLPIWLLRRKYVVNPRRQLRAALLVSAVSMIPVVILVFNLAYTRSLEREVIFGGAHVAIEQQVWEHDRTEAMFVIAASLVYLFGVFAITVVETHQTSGAALGVVRHLRNVRDGRYDTRLHLRDSDNLQELTEPFNQMAIAIQARSIRMADALDDLAEESSGLADGGGIADRLRELADNERRHAGKKTQ